MSNSVYLKTFSPIELSYEVFDNIAELAYKCIQKGRFPYTKDIPLPPNRDIITNHKLNSVQSIELELHNSLLGDKDQNWIFGANAYLLGLDLKISKQNEYNKMLKENPNFDCNPIVAYAKVMHKTKSNQILGSSDTNILKEGLCIDCQTIYSLNQFTEESIRKCFQQATLKDHLLLRGDINLTEENRTAIAQTLIENLSTNRCDAFSVEKRKNIVTNVLSNLKGDNPEIRNTINLNLKECKKNLNETEKKCFDTLWSYFLKQNGYSGGIKLSHRATDEDFLKLINENDSKKFSKLLFDASIFAERLTHYGFSFDLVFTQLEFNNSIENIKNGKSPSYLLPKAAEKEKYFGENFISERTKQKIKGKDYQYIKPKQEQFTDVTRNREIEL